MTKQKNRSSEQHLRATTQAAEAVALGTMAGGLALGAVQAREAQPVADDGDHEARPAAPQDQGAYDQPQAAALEPGLVASQKSVPTTADASQAIEIIKVDGATTPPVTNPNDNAAVVQAVESDGATVPHMSGAIERLVTEITKDGTPDGEALSLAGQILGSVADIVSSLKPGTDAASLGDAIHIQVLNTLQPTTEALAHLPSAISDTVDAALGSLTNDLSALPAVITASVADTLDLGSLPTAILGNDGATADHGFLSNLFYSDGEADPAPIVTGLGITSESLFIPQLSETASSIVADATEGTLGLLGLSYTDLSPDGTHPASGGVGALGLL